MKSKWKKRLVALVLCMVVAISNSSFIFASENAEADYSQEAEVQTASGEPAAVATYAEEEAQPVAEEQPTVEETAAEEPVATESEEQPTVETPVAEESATVETPAEEPSADEKQTPTEETPAQEEEKQNEEAETEETIIYNQQMVLKHEFQDADGKVTATVKAEIPEGAFEVKENSEVTMKVTTLTETETKHLENLMKEEIPDEKELGQYVAYNITFKVDDTKVDSLKPIKITMTGDKTQIDDVENAKVFYFDPADPDVAGDKDELNEIIQKAALIKSLQEAGQSIENIDEDYDLSEITLNEDGTAKEIQMEGRTSTIYGCYVAEIPEEDPAEEPTEEPAENPDTEELTEETQDPTTYAADTTGNALTLDENNGKLQAAYTAVNTGDYGYVWYRSINGAAFEAQEPTTYTSSTGVNLGSDIKEDGSELYIALNGGALGYKENGVTNTEVKYKVAVFKKEDIKNSGLPKEGVTAVTESREYSVTSYYEVRNGGFETPNVQDKNTAGNQYNHYQYSNAEYASSGGVWQTTGTGTKESGHLGHDIEIINTKDGNFKSPYSWYGDDGAAEGNQFAELNCEAAGALYQDVLTTPGETLNYQLSHRARGSHQNDTSEKDTMYVLIMSTALAEKYDVTTEAKAQAIVNHPENYSGATVVQYTDDDQKWTTHQGVYNVPTNSNQYLTRFFFVAGTTASGSNTVGNFLDNIKLTRDKLTPVEGTARVNVTKSITGLKYADANTLANRLIFTVGKHTLSYSDLSWSWSGEADSYGTLTGTYVLTIPESEFGTLNVSEQATNGSLEVTGYDRNSSLFIDESNSDQETEGTITVENKDVRSVEFKNNYSLQDGGTNPDVESKVSHQKYIKRNTDGTYDITLNVSGTVESKTVKKNLDIVLIVDTSGSMGNEVSVGNGQTKSRLQLTKDAISGLVTTFNSKSATVDVRYKLVTFASLATTKTSNWVSGNQLLTNYINTSGRDALVADGGTNYDRGLTLGSEAINTSKSTAERPDVEKIVIFLTDGEPTYYGTGPSGGDGSYMTDTIYNEAKKSAAKISCNKFYSIGIGLKDKVTMWSRKGGWNGGWTTSEVTGISILTEIANKTTATTKEATNLSNPAELGNKFQQIAGDILEFACENVVITDQLSEYVEPTANSRLVIKEAVKNANGGYTLSDTVADIKLNETGTISLTDKNGNHYSATARYDATTKTATLTFDSGYKLQQDHYYYLTITNVTPTEEAFKEYQTGTGYNATGDRYTDASADGYEAVNEGTSSGKKGFQSNASANVSYTYKGESHNEPYDDPVIQVEKINVEKKWVGVKANDIKNQTILVQLVDKNDKPVDGKVLKLTSQNNFKGSFVVEETDNYGGVRELVLDKDNGTITFEKNKYSMVEDNGITIIDGNSYEVTYSKFKDGKQTITNTRNSEKIKIIKTGTNTALKLKGAEFTLKDGEGNLVKVGSHTDDTYVSGDKGLVLEGNLKKGAYTLKEVKAPEGYVVLPNDITITVSENGVTVAGSDKVTCEKDEDDVYVITVQNEVVYDLPSTGHTGIFYVMMSGILLMFAGILIIFKMRGKGVLKR